MNRKEIKILLLSWNNLRMLNFVSIRNVDQAWCWTIWRRIWSWRFSGYVISVIKSRGFPSKRDGKFEFVANRKYRMMIVWQLIIPFNFQLMSITFLYLIDMCRSTHFKRVTTESVDGRRLSALVFVIFKGFISTYYLLAQ